MVLDVGRFAVRSLNDVEKVYDELEMASEEYPDNVVVFPLRHDLPPEAA